MERTDAHRRRQPGRAATAPAAAIAIAVWVHYALYDLHAWLGLKTNMVSNAVDGNMQTVVYDLSQPNPWTLHLTMVQLSFAVFVLAWGIVHWRSFAAVAFSLWGMGWFCWQAYDEASAGNKREPGKWEWIILLWAFVSVTIVSVVHERVRRSNDDHAS